MYYKHIFTDSNMYSKHRCADADTHSKHRCADANTHYKHRFPAANAYYKHRLQLNWTCTMKRQKLVCNRIFFTCGYDKTKVIVVCLFNRTHFRPRIESAGSPGPGHVLRAV